MRLIAIVWWLFQHQIGLGCQIPEGYTIRSFVDAIPQNIKDAMYDLSERSVSIGVRGGGVGGGAGFNRNK